jgi:hypothetical protein
VVECLSNKHEALSSNPKMVVPHPSTTKIKARLSK